MNPKYYDTLHCDLFHSYVSTGGSNYSNYKLVEQSSDNRCVLERTCTSICTFYSIFTCTCFQLYYYYVPYPHIYFAKNGVFFRRYQFERDGHALLTRPNTRHKMRLARVWEKALPTYGRTDGRIDGRTDGRTDRPSYRDARTHLKTYYGRRKLPKDRQTNRHSGV